MGDVAGFLAKMGAKVGFDFDEFVGTAVEKAGQQFDEGLRYMEDQGALGSLLNRYYSNMNRGSKLTTRDKMQETPLGKMKVNVGRVPLQETGRTVIRPSATVDVQPLTVEQFEQMRIDQSKFIHMVWDRSDLGVLTRVNDEVLLFVVHL